MAACTTSQARPPDASLLGGFAQGGAHISYEASMGDAFLIGIVCSFNEGALRRTGSSCLLWSDATALLCVAHRLAERRHYGRSRCLPIRNPRNPVSRAQKLQLQRSPAIRTVQLCVILEDTGVDATG